MQISINRASEKSIFDVFGESMDNDIPIDIKQRRVLEAGMKELVESICHMDCYDLFAGDIKANPYDINEPEYRWYKEYALKVFGVVCVPENGREQAV